MSGDRPLIYASVTRINLPLTTEGAQSICSPHPLALRFGRCDPSEPFAGADVARSEDSHACHNEKLRAHRPARVDR